MCVSSHTSVYTTRGESKPLLATEALVDPATHYFELKLFRPPGHLIS